MIDGCDVWMDWYNIWYDMYGWNVMCLVYWWWDNVYWWYDGVYVMWNGMYVWIDGSMEWMWCIWMMVWFVYVCNDDVCDVYIMGMIYECVIGCDGLIWLMVYVLLWDVWIVCVYMYYGWDDVNVWYSIGMDICMMNVCMNVGDVEWMEWDVCVLFVMGE